MTMQLSNGTAVGLCYSFGMAAAQLWTIASTEPGRRCLWPDPRAILKMVGWSLVFTTPVACAIWALDRALKGLDAQPNLGLHVSTGFLLAIAWAVAALYTFVHFGGSSIRKSTGQNVLKQNQLRNALTGGAIGMILSGLYIFGPHVL